jgi:hypothetical protein
VTSIVVAGALANKPHNGGEAWVRLSWLLGLERLGLQPWFVEEIAPATAVDGAGRAVPLEGSVNAAWFDAVVSRFGLAERAALVRPDGQTIRGPAAEPLRDVMAAADLLVNISGNLTTASLLQLPSRRAYLDLDPGYTQFWHLDGHLGSALERHEHLLTVGLSLGRRSCRIPTAGRPWRPVPPPVVLDEWPAVDPPDEWSFTTVASWRGGHGRLEHEGRAFGQKAHEFRRFADVPRLARAPFEAALDIHAGDVADRNLLVEGGWRLVDPRRAAGTPEAFRRYVQASGAEFSPAQGVYVETACGWFSDRTTRYLASGRPALVQDTVQPTDIPVGEGLLTFRDMRDAIRGVQSIAADYDRHRAGARRIAEQHFASEVVLTGLLADLL